jgi:TPR repeat protein
MYKRIISSILSILLTLQVTVASTEKTTEAENPLKEVIELAEQGNMNAQFILANYYQLDSEENDGFKKAAIWYRKAAKQGLSAAQATMGIYNSNGYGVPQNYKKAIEWYTKAAEQNDAGSQTALGDIFSNTYGVVDYDYSKALQWYRRAAALGDKFAHSRIGKMYEKGHGVSKSERIAKTWYAKSSAIGNERESGSFSEVESQVLSTNKLMASFGDAGSQFQLANMYQEGRVVQKNLDEAKHWYIKAAEQGNKEAQVTLARIYDRGNYTKKALDLYILAAEQGSAAALYKLGRRNTDEGKSAVYYFKSAEQNNSDALEKLAYIHLYGYGVKQDIVKAAMFYRKAVEQGDMFSHRALAQHYQKSQGVEQDLELAEKLLLKYLELTNNSSEAKYLLGKHYKDFVKNYDKALTFFNMISSPKYSFSLEEKAEMYEKGLGVKQDLSQALILYKKSDSYKGKIKYKLLDKIVNCEKYATTKLFNLSVICTDRESFRSALKNEGAIFDSEDIINFADIYNSSKVLAGSTKLTVYYLNEKITSAQYTFPSRGDEDLVTNIRNLVRSKYGKEQSPDGKVLSENLTYIWNLEDGIILEVRRDESGNTVFMTFTEPNNDQQRLDTIEQLKSTKEAEKYKKQSNAF